MKSDAKLNQLEIIFYESFLLSKRLEFEFLAGSKIQHPFR